MWDNGRISSLLLKCQSAVEGADLQQAASPAGRRSEGRQTALVFNLSASFGSYLRRASLVKSDMGSQHFASTQKKKKKREMVGGGEEFKATYILHFTEATRQTGRNCLPRSTKAL